VLETTPEDSNAKTVEYYILKNKCKTLEHPGPCSVLGAGHYPRTGVGGEGVSGPYF